MSEQRHERPAPTWRASTLDDLARAQDARAVIGVEELADDIWSSDEELDAFLISLKASRDTSLA